MSIIVCLHDLSMLYVDTRTSFDHALSHKSMVHGSIVYVPLAKFGALEKKTGLQDVKVWNYDFIVLGREFMERNFKEGFAVMQEFYMSLGKGEKLRNSKPCTWSVDLCTIDLPTSTSCESIISLMCLSLYLLKMSIFT